MPDNPKLIIEGSRTQMDNTTSLTVTFGLIHKAIPCVSVTAESTVTGDSNPIMLGANIYIESVTRTAAVVKCSALFDGYIHLHAISTR